MGLVEVQTGCTLHDVLANENKFCYPVKIFEDIKCKSPSFPTFMITSAI